MKIAVIGAGAAGLAALRQCTSGNYDDEVVCYEKTDQIGGTWVYREETGSDRYGLLIHTSMYKNLRYESLHRRQFSFFISRQFSVLHRKRILKILQVHLINILLLYRDFLLLILSTIINFTILKFSYLYVFYINV